MPSLPLYISPGDNLVARIDDLVVFAHGDADHLRSLTRELTDLLPETDWSGLLQFLAAQISTRGFDNFPPITCVQAGEGVTDVFVFGGLEVSVTTSTTTETITGAGMTTWREARVDGELESVSAGAGDNGEGVLGMLVRGLVSGGGFRLAMNPGPIQKSMLSAISGATTVAATAPPESDAPLSEVQAEPQPEELASDDAYEVTLDPDEFQSEMAAPKVAEPMDSVDTASDLPGGMEPSVVQDAELAEYDDASGVDTITALDEPESIGSNGDQDGFDPSQAAMTETISLPTQDDDDAAADDVDDFDPNVTTAYSGVILSDAVRSARAASPDPRRSSGPEGEASEPLETAQTSLLRGILCPNEHLSSMQGSVCRTCSEPVDMDGPIVSGPRPILGVIEFDDGVRIPLDQPVVIGRQPPEDYQINGESAYVVPITDAEGLISRVHVEVHLIGWDVELIDKNSVNGTFTSASTDSGSRTKLRPEHPTQIELGTIIYTGDRVFRLNTGRIV